MAIINRLLHLFALTLVFTLVVSSSDPPESPPSPSPSPQSGSEDPVSVSPSSPSPSIGSQPAPPPSDPSPSPSPSPVPSDSTDVSADVKNEEEKESSEGGMSSGKKVGVVFGLIAAACFVGFGGMVYKKRQENIRRAQYRYAARMDFM